MVGGEARDRLAQVAAALGGTRGGHEERWKRAALARQGVGEVQAHVQVGAQLGQHGPRAAPLFLLGQQVNGLDEREAGIEQRHQFLAEQLEREHRA